MDNATDLQAYIRRLEALIVEERAARQNLEATVVEKQTYITLLESFVIAIGKKLGVTRQSREALTDIATSIDRLLALR